MATDIVWLAKTKPAIDQTASDVLQDEPGWGSHWVPRLLEALDIDDPQGRITGVQLRFETDSYPSFVLFEGDKVIAHGWAFVRGILGIKEALELPEIAQVLTITAKNDEFVQFEYQFAFEKDVLDKVIAVLETAEE